MIRVDLRSESGAYVIETIDGDTRVRLTAQGDAVDLKEDGSRRVAAALRQLVYICATEDVVARVRKRAGV